MDEKEGPRRFPRYDIPAELEIPSLSDTPVTPENVSASGFHIVVPTNPEESGEIHVSFKISDMSFERVQALRAWSEEVHERPGMYHVGLLMIMNEDDRDGLLNQLESMTKKK